MAINLVLALLLPFLAMAYGQAACQCNEIGRCLQEYDQQLLTAAANCRSQCQTMLGPNYATAALKCFADKEAQLVAAKTTLRTCFEAKAGQPCVSNNAGNPGAAGAGATTAAPAGAGVKRRRRDIPPVPGLPPVLVLPPNVRNFILCYAGCQRAAFAVAVDQSQGRGGIYGYPGCARMLNCVLVRPSNFTGGLAAQVDCGIQAGAQTQVVFQTFCQCLKTALGADSQFLNCDVYGTPQTPSSGTNTNATGTGTTTEAPAEFFFNF